MELSDEILVSEVLPRWDYPLLLKSRLINRRWYDLYNDDTLWLIKVRTDFPTYQRKNITVSWKNIYRHLVKTRQTFLMDVFDLGMYLRGWQGSRLIYPLGVRQCDWPNYDEVYVSIIKIYERWDSLPNDAKSILDDLRLMRYQQETGYVAWLDRPSLIEHVVQLGLGEACGRITSRYLIVSALYYLKTFYNTDIPNCKITSLQSIS
jgi:hypothetical protein